MPKESNKLTIKMMFVIVLLVVTAQIVVVSEMAVLDSSTSEANSEYKAFTNVPSMPFGRLFFQFHMCICTISYCFIMLQRSDMIATTFSASLFTDEQGPRIYLTGC
jgi:uncharacterized membrane protein